MATIPQPKANVQAAPSPEAAKSALRTGKWDDDSALQIVVQDALKAESYEAQKQWVMQWPMATALYQSPFGTKYWEGTQVERSNIPFYTVATAVNGLVPQIINGLFFENPPFMVQNRPGTSDLAASAIGALLGYQVEDIDFREELRLGVMNAVLFGTSIWKWGWETFTRDRAMYKRTRDNVVIPAAVPGDKATHLADDDNIEEVIEEEYVDRPVFEHMVNLRHVLVDPGLQVPDIRKAKYVVHRLYMTWKDLDRLRERPGFDIPTREKLLEYFLPPKEEAVMASSEVGVKNPMWDARAESRYEKTSVDPFQEPLEVLEYWTKDMFIVVLQQKVVICNAKNPYGKIPFLSLGWWDVPEAFWSMGLAKTIGAEQRLQQGVTNLWMDNASLNLNGVYVRVRGKSVPTQSIRLAPGKIVEVDSKDDFQPVKRTDAVPEAQTHIAMSQGRVDSVSGASPITTQGQAGAAGHSNLGRSSAGAQLLGSGASASSSDFVEKLSSQVIIPFLVEAHQLNRALLPMDNLTFILGTELQHEFVKGKNDVVELLNARVKFTILAGAKMAARRQMAQALPIMIQYLTSEQTTQQLALQGKKVNVAELLRMMFEVSEWKNYADVVVDMTAEDQKRWQQTTPAAQAQAKAKGQMDMMQQQHSNKSQLVDQENIARAGREVLRQAIEKQSEPFAMTGQASPNGLGLG